jgi:hypothetical protein
MRSAWHVKGLVSVVNNTGWRTASSGLREMDLCQSGFHDPKNNESQILVSRLTADNKTVNLCTYCYGVIQHAMSNKQDLTMYTLYHWAKECGNAPPLPGSLKENCLKRAELVQYVNNELGKKRTTTEENRNQNFPTILLFPKEKDEFIQILEENEDSVQSILHDVYSDGDRKNIALRLWVGCLYTAKLLRRDYVAEHNSDGTPKRLEPITPKMRQDNFNSMAEILLEDPIYEAGVQAAPVWELKLNEEPDKKMSLEGIPNPNDSPCYKVY